MHMPMTLYTTTRRAHAHERLPAGAGQLEHEFLAVPVPRRQRGEGGGGGGGGLPRIILQRPGLEAAHTGGLARHPRLSHHLQGRNHPITQPIPTIPITQHHSYHPLTLQLNLLPQAIPITFLPPHRHTPSPHHHRHHSPTPSLAQVSDTASFDVGAQTNGPSLTRMLASGARRCEHGSMA